MLLFMLIAAQAAGSGQASITPTAPPLPPNDVLPASARAVVDHVDALYRGDIDRALVFVADDVQNSVSDLSSNLHFPAGRTVTKAMYLSITRKGSLPLSWFACRPEDQLVRCDMRFGNGKKLRDFTLRYQVNGGPITHVYSWENHKPAKR